MILQYILKKWFRLYNVLKCSETESISLVFWEILWTPRLDLLTSLWVLESCSEGVAQSSHSQDKSPLIRTQQHHTPKVSIWSLSSISCQCATKSIFGWVGPTKLFTSRESLQNSEPLTVFSTSPFSLASKSTQVVLEWKQRWPWETLVECWGLWPSRSCNSTLLSHSSSA